MPAECAAFCQIRGARVEQLGIVQHIEFCSSLAQTPLDVVLLIDRPEVGTAHSILVRHHTRPTLEKMICGKRCTDSATGVAGGWLQPDAIEVFFPQQLAVGYA